MIALPSLTWAARVGPLGRVLQAGARADSARPPPAIRARQPLRDPRLTREPPNGDLLVDVNGVNELLAR